VAVVLSRVATFAIDGIDPRPVWVEVDVRPGLPTFRVVGMVGKAVRESRDRVRAAVLNSGFEFPARRITANLAPASLPKVGPGFDAGLAVGCSPRAVSVPPRDWSGGLSSASCHSAASCAPAAAFSPPPRARVAAA
jgi:magnesium chelatase family protein